MYGARRLAALPAPRRTARLARAASRYARPEGPAIKPVTITLDTNTQGFSVQNAKACALASWEAYQSATVTDPGTDTQVNITCAPAGNVIIAFRGSKSLRDWITDFQAWREALRGCSVHFGFLTAVRAVMVRVCAELSKIIGLKKVFVTGHSLGGALAQLFAYEYPGPIHGIYTFGQPRIGDVRFHNLYQLLLGEKTFRVVHEQDIVPRVPFLVFGYRHAGVEVLLNSFGRTEINPTWRHLLLSDVWGEFSAWRKKNLLAAVEPFSDHNLTNYLGRLA